MNIIQKQITKTIFPCITSDNRISYTEGGRIICDHCKSKNGVKVRSYMHKGRLRLSKRCVSCKALEITDNWNGEILRQEIDMMLINKYK